MESLDVDRPPTPPHHPTAGVRVLREEIDNIASHAFPDSALLSVTQLASGKSYNNRIYFLTLRQHPADSATPPEQQVVLKVNGRFFGAHKVQNEVACLQLLQAHCPDVPSPRALAWSEDGHVATFATPLTTGSVSLDESLGLNSHTLGHGGWILMTRVPGAPLLTDELDEATMTDLAGQLGDMVSSWRRNIPAQPHCGNIRLPRGASETGHTTSLGESSPLEIRGILQESIVVDEPITSTNEYYRIKLADKLRVLELSPTYAPNRSLAGPLRAFIAETLPHLPLAAPPGHEGPYVFTHYDLSPRNVLVAGRPPRVVGLVDFEFAGFFPPADEFLNDHVANAGDWPRAFYEAYLRRLERNGVATPRGALAAGRDGVWGRSYRLETLLARVAPWELPGGLEGEALAGRLREAEAGARRMLEELSGPDEVWEPVAAYGDDA